MTMTAQDLATRLGAKRVGKEYVTHCPAHPDQHPSLNFTDGRHGRGIVFQCRSRGCSLDAILTGFALTREDVGIGSNGHPPDQLRREFVYSDEHRTPLSRVVRVEPGFNGKRKSIWQESLQPDGRWVNGTRGVRRVPYRLADLQGERTVYIPEGEPHCDRLWHEGVPATCNIGGAGKWTDLDSAALVAAGVEHAVILPDNDDVGRTHAKGVAESLHRAGISPVIVPLPDLPRKGGDILDWFGAGRTVADLFKCVEASPFYDPAPTTVREAGVPAAAAPAASPDGRYLRAIPATAFQIEPVRWLLKDRIPLGAFTGLAGREGIGKSVYIADLAARVTRGTLPGALEGEPRAVFIVATEDSWKHTIVPRLMAAGADLTRVFCVEVVAPTGASLALSLPQDLIALEQAARDRGAALLVFDPLISRLDSALDTHKDASVRQALEPLAAMAERLEAAVVGLIHVSKSQSSDALTLLMGSRAFAAVARAVLFAMIDPDDDTRRLLGQPKNNLGRTDLPTLTFAIQGVCVATTDKGEVWTGHLEWGEPVESHDSRSARESG